MDLGLTGKKAVVVGGTRGIGRAIAETLIEEGCDIAIGARNGEQVDSTVTELAVGAARVIGAPVDAGDGPGLEQFVVTMGEQLGGIDVYISNASGAFGGGNDLASWQRGVDVDILGTVRGCEAALPFLERSEHGAIVLIGSVSSIESVGDRRAYNSVKAAILPYAKGMARDVAGHGVRCNVVSPGQIYFPGGVWNVVEEHAPDRFAEALARNPMGRMGSPREVASAVAFLASPRASFISGTHLLVDGARTQNVQF
jgi:3-oxoacyl-[acyl-carrier protein] reductase